MSSDPNVVTTSTNRNLLQPTKASKGRRESHLREELDKGKHRSRTSKAQSRAPVVDEVIAEDSSSSSNSMKSGRSQLVDLVVEDKDAEQTERVRARKEGGAAWNVDEPKHFLYVSHVTLIFKLH